jgi:hypothetical protein
VARTSWLALLAFLAYIGITLLAVQDPDFFVPSRRTDLPLVGISIPTFSFFLFAPPLAAALYIYLHIHLLRLWDAPPPDLDRFIPDRLFATFLRAQFLCGPDNPRRKTGTPCPVDLPREECRAWAVARGWSSRINPSIPSKSVCIRPVHALCMLRSRANA